MGPISDTGMGGSGSSESEKGVGTSDAFLCWVPEEWK